MAVYMLGAGASWCTDTYSHFAAENDWLGEFRPPLMADFFRVAHSRFPGLRMRNLDAVLEPVGLSVTALERREAGCANIEHVLSFCDLLQRAIAHRAYGPLHRGRIRRAVWDLERALARRPFHFLYLPPDTRRLCRKVKGWPIFGQHPKRNLVRGAEALREASRRSRGGPPPSGLSDWESVSFGLGLNSPTKDILKAICEVYGPSSPYLSRGSPAPPGLCSNYSRFLENKVRADDTVITFNYDFLLDRVLEEKAALRPDERLGPLPTLFDAPGGAAHLLKLHGSVLWWVERNKEQQRQYYQGDGNAGDIRCMTSSEALASISSVEGCSWLPAHRPPDKYVEPLIVPPTIAKEEHLARPEISQLWRQAERELSTTDKVYVIGYSFPRTDTHVTNRIEAAARSRPSGDYKEVSVKIVSKSRRDDLQRLREDIQKAFAGAHVQVESNEGFDHWVARKAS